MMHKLAVFVVTLSIVVSICSSGFAQEPEKDWRFELAPLYLWGIAISGDMTVKGNESEVEADFGDIFSNLNGVFTVHFDTAWKQKWGGFVDLNYVNLEADKNTPLEGRLHRK
jgi:hypothetical protein